MESTKQQFVIDTPEKVELYVDRIRNLLLEKIVREGDKGIMYTYERLVAHGDPFYTAFKDTHSISFEVITKEVVDI